MFMKTLASLWMLIAIGLSACDPAEHARAPTGTLHVGVSRPALHPITFQTGALHSSFATRRQSVHVALEDGNGKTTVRKFVDGALAQATTFDELTPGDYTLSAHALDNEDGPFDGHTLYTTSTKVTIPSGADVATHLILEELSSGDGNITAPFIHAISVAGGPPVIGKPLTLTGTVRGAPSQTYLWSVSCADDPAPDAPFTNPTGLMTQLTLGRCSSEAVVTFSVTNRGGSNGHGSLTSTVRFTLGYAPQGITMSVSINSWPNITSIGTASNTEPVPGGTIELVAIASDPDGDLLIHAWSDDCGGSFTGANTLTPTWTAPLTAGSLCELKLTVREAGNAEGHNDGVNTGTLTLKVAPSL
jgi:hypothetical protein